MKFIVNRTVSQYAYQFTAPLSAAFFDISEDDRIHFDEDDHGTTFEEYRAEQLEESLQLTQVAMETDISKEIVTVCSIDEQERIGTILAVGTCSIPENTSEHALLQTVQEYIRQWTTKYDQWIVAEHATLQLAPIVDGIPLPSFVKED